jgi:hypothetical protein
MLSVGGKFSSLGGRCWECVNGNSLFNMGIGKYCCEVCWEDLLDNAAERPLPYRCNHADLGLSAVNRVAGGFSPPAPTPNAVDLGFTKPGMHG